MIALLGENSYYSTRTSKDNQFPNHCSWYSLLRVNLLWRNLKHFSKSPDVYFNFVFTDFHSNASDVALVTSLRDGMNLVSYEFVACQDAKKGVLILSEVKSSMTNLLLLWHPSHINASICCLVCWSCTIPWCWSYSCEPMEHHRSGFLNRLCFEYGCWRERKATPSQFLACNHTHCSRLGKNFCEVHTLRWFEI